jgi:hypothetical protein
LTVAVVGWTLAELTAQMCVHTERTGLLIREAGISWANAAGEIS